MVVVFRKTILTLLLLALSIWVVRYGLLRQRVEARNYRYTAAERQALQSFADAWVDYGVKAWYENQPDTARADFRNGLARNALHVDAWLELARLEATLGNASEAGAILAFADTLTRNVVKWKWPQLLLARDLGIESIFLDNINFVVAYPQLRMDALNLLDRHVEGDTSAALRILEPRHLPDYLGWLMRWKRWADGLAVWGTMTEPQQQQDGLQDRFINFLVGQKQIRAAIEIWQAETGNPGWINPGFEAPFSTSAFDWKASSGEHWRIERDASESVEGEASLRIDFHGKENIHFAHLRRISPVTPGTPYRLRFRWRASDLTTDQRPYIEVRGIECPGVWKTEMAPATTDWREETLGFTAPESCAAVAVTLRRNPSRRFNSRINGRLWLDDFQLTPIARP